MNIHFRHKIAVLFVTLFLFLSLTACSSTEKNQTEQPTQTLENVEEQGRTHADTSSEGDSGTGTMGPFWKVSHNGNDVYLLGSIHVAKPELYPLHEKIESAFDSADALAVEVDVVHVNVFEMQKMIDERALYKDGTTLRDHVSAYYYSLLKNEFKKYNINLALFERYEPWYISMLLESIQMMKLGYDANLGIDYHFIKKASGQKDIIELESAEFQLDLLDSFSEDLQLTLLKSSIKDIEEIEDEIEEMFEIWKSGNEDDLLALIEGSEEISAAEEDLYAEYTKKMLDDRNMGMVDKIEQFLRGNAPKTYFVVVGAAHYVGESGIIELLRERGYTVEKITP